MTNDLIDGIDQMPQIPDNVDYLVELTGPGKKFDRTKYTSEAEMLKAIARGKYEADHFIDFSNKEKDKLRQDYLKEKSENDARAKLQELIEKLTTKEPTHSELPLANEGAKVPELDLSKIESLFDQKYDQKVRTEKETNNFNQVKAKLTEKYGTQYPTVFKNTAEQLGFSTEEMTALAKRSPEAFYRAMGMDRPAEGSQWQAPPGSSTRSDAFVPTSGSKAKTESQYDQIRIANPKLYWDQKTQTQMHKDAMELQEKFFDLNA